MNFSGLNTAHSLHLTEIAPDMWVVESSGFHLGLRVQNRMTVVRLSSGKLWLHAPISPHLYPHNRLEGLGPVGYIVVPNRQHSRHVMDSFVGAPSAKLFVAPGLSDMDATYAGFPVIPPTEQSPWNETFDSVFIEGNPALNETVFFHRLSRTLIITDLAIHIGPQDGPLLRFVARMHGSYQQLGHPWPLRRLFRDRDAARRSILRVLDWNFERIIPAHGPIVSSNAQSTFQSAFAWLL